MHRIRLGILGCSDIAGRRLLPAVAGSSAEPVAVASRDAARAATFANRFGCAAVQGYDMLLAREDVDAVYVSVPTGLHWEWALAALRAGKHVLVEKPLATTAAEGAELITTAHDQGLQVMENRMFVHHPQHARVAELISSGAIGELKVITAAMAIPPLAADNIRYRADLGGGALLDVGYYPLHAALLYASTDLTVAGASRQLDGGSGVDLGGAVLLRESRGVAAQLTYGFEHSYRSFYELWGEHGRIVLDRAFTPDPDHRPVVRLERRGQTKTLPSVPACDQFRAALEVFASAVRGERDLTAEHDRTLAGLRLIDAVREAAERT